MAISDLHAAGRVVERPLLEGLGRRRHRIRRLRPLGQGLLAHRAGFELVGLLEDSTEGTHDRVSQLPADLRDRQVGFAYQALGLDHAQLGDIAFERPNRRRQAVAHVAARAAHFADEVGVEGGVKEVLDQALEQG